MDYFFVCVVTLLATALTFVSGFGLGTLLLPAFALFAPLPAAIAATALVHLANNLFKLALVGRWASWSVVARFGAPAVVGAIAGALVLAWLGPLPPLLEYSTRGRSHSITPVKLLVGVLIAAFGFIELRPKRKQTGLPPRFLPLGGLTSGFFGGLSGHQGALRSMLLIRAGLTKEQFIGTGVVCAVLVDVPRIAVYAGAWKAMAAPHRTHVPVGMLAAATAAALVGTLFGAALAKRIALRIVELIVAVGLGVFGLALSAGLL